MRLILKIKSDNEVVLPLNYQEVLQGFIYKNLNNKDFSTFLHDEGYSYEKRNYKLFTFSRLSGFYTIDKKAKRIIFKGEICWQISSVIPEFIQYFGQNLLLSNDLNLNGQVIKIEELKYTDFKVTSSKCKISMLSPIITNSTELNENGDKYTHFYSPEDKEFNRLISNNYKKKYEAFTNQKTDEELLLKPVKVDMRDKVITKYKDYIINGWGGKYELEAKPEVIQFLYNVGLGSRNSQGFGMFEIIN